MFFPTWHRSDSLPTAGVSGILVERDRCLFLKGPGSEQLALWEDVYSYVKGALYDSSGTLLARVGEAVHGGGGGYSDRGYAEELVGQPIPNRCLPGGADPYYVLIYEVQPGPGS